MARKRSRAALRVCKDPPAKGDADADGTRQGEAKDQHESDNSALKRARLDEPTGVPAEQIAQVGAVFDRSEASTSMCMSEMINASAPLNRQFRGPGGPVLSQPSTTYGASAGPRPDLDLGRSTGMGMEIKLPMPMSMPMPPPPVGCSNSALASSQLGGPYSRKGWYGHGHGHGHGSVDSEGPGRGQGWGFGSTSTQSASGGGRHPSVTSLLEGGGGGSVSSGGGLSEIELDLLRGLTAMRSSGGSDSFDGSGSTMNRQTGAATGAAAAGGSRSGAFTAGLLPSSRRAIQTKASTA